MPGLVCNTDSLPTKVSVNIQNPRVLLYLAGLVRNTDSLPTKVSVNIQNPRVLLYLAGLVRNTDSLPTKVSVNIQNPCVLLYLAAECQPLSVTQIPYPQRFLSIYRTLVYYCTWQLNASPCL